MRCQRLALLGFCAALSVGGASSEAAAGTPEARPQHAQPQTPGPPAVITAYGRVYVLANQATREVPAEKFLGLGADGWVALFTLALTISTALLWIETKRLAEDGERAIRAAEKAALAAEKSSETSEKALLNLEGAIIQPSGMRFRHDDSMGEILFQFKNFGRSPATVNNVSATINITPANTPNKIQATASRSFMFDDMIGDKDVPEQLVFKSDILRQYANLIQESRIDLHIILTYSWENLLGVRKTVVAKFIWSPKRGRFLSGIQLWDDPERFPPKPNSK